MNMNQAKIIIFSAPSGSGKTTIVKYLLNQELPLTFSVSATSRDKRIGEVHGRDYWFLSADEFRERIEKKDFVEWEEVYPNQYYGTLMSEIDRLHEQGIQVLFDVDVVGGLNLKKKFGEDALAIFVMPPSLEDLESRLYNRKSESLDSLRKRVKKAADEMKYADQFDVILRNEEITIAQQEALQLVKDFINS